MTEIDFHRLIHRRLAQISIGPSTIRSQGAGGLIRILRGHFEQIDLAGFSNALPDEKEYRGFLDFNTQAILDKFPADAKSWGAARKGLNLFLREVVYSNYFSAFLSLPKDFNELNDFLKNMEVPLDRDVAHGLIEDANGALPKWKTIKGLTPDISKLYQDSAMSIAENENIARVNLDLKYWRKKRD